MPADLALDLDERVKVGLVTLCTREKELYLEQFEQQILSRRMVAVLTADADRLIDGVRDKGVARLRGVAGRHLAARPRLSRLPVAAPAAGLGAHADGAPGRPLRDPDGDPERAGRAWRLQHQLGGRPFGQRRRGSPRRRDRQPPGGGRQRLQGPVAAVSRLRRIDRDAAARARRHPLRDRGVQSPPEGGHHQPRGLQRPARAARRAPRRHQQAAAARSWPGVGQDDRARAAVRLARPPGSGRGSASVLRAVVALPGEKIIRVGGRPIRCTSSPRAR